MDQLPHVILIILKLVMEKIEMELIIHIQLKNYVDQPFQAQYYQRRLQ